MWTLFDRRAKWSGSDALRKRAECGMTYLQCSSELLIAIHPLGCDYDAQVQLACASHRAVQPTSAAAVECTPGNL